MNSWRRLVDALYWLALAAWFAALITAAISASSIFSLLGDLPLHLPEYAAAPDSEHGRIAAGIVMARIFLVVDLLQFAAAPMVLITMLLQHLMLTTPWRRFAALLRAFVLAFAVGLFAWHAVKLAPTMNRELQSYWSAVKLGDAETAEAHRAAFNIVHPTAENILRVNLLLLACGILLSPAVLDRSASRSGRLDIPTLAKQTP
jgi:hypothetical protein